MKTSAKGTVNVKTTVVISGREYASVEEMPPDVRRVYEQALGGAAVHPSGEGGFTTKVVFNGREYTSVETMPDDVRGFYEAAMDAVRSENAAPGGRGHGALKTRDAVSRMAAPIDVSGGSQSAGSKLATAAIVILGALVVLYVLMRALHVW